ncbi:hypothetical protein ALQ95_100790 [Pseudomonas syringae pv. ribicola]|uniref:Uncharacterized protein n=1 Tax=Pseudomonas syringae pv. ribicola TaxID=55398 RepID=A0A3M2VRW1_PSESI|nr:hypothetical protein ALQ95_100790 [Pseudomonas syringae pv. ribicola]
MYNPISGLLDEALTHSKRIGSGNINSAKGPEKALLHK